MRDCRSSKTGVCPLCGRECLLTFHHLIPRKAQRRGPFKRNRARSGLAAGIPICRLCHNGIHDLYDEVTLAKRFNSVEALRADPALHKHFAWVAKQKLRARCDPEPDD